MKSKLLYFFLFIFLIINLSCTGEDLVKISVRVLSYQFYDDSPLNIVVENEVPKNIKLGGLTACEIIDIKGLEKLPNLKILDISSCKTDLIFLKELTNLEQLFLSGSCTNIEYIKYLKNLKILILRSLKLYETKEIDFSNNKQLEFMELGYLSFLDQDLQVESFELKIWNLPDTLECVNIHYNSELIINKEFLKQLETVPIVILKPKYYQSNKKYFNTHPNFYFVDCRKCPEMKELLGEYEFTLYPLEIEWSLFSKN